MSGVISVEEAFESRISLLSPSCSTISQFLQEHKPIVNPGVHELLSILRERNTPFFLVSGGFYEVLSSLTIHRLVDCPHL